jgi:transposase
MDKKKLIKSLKQGVPIRWIAKEMKVTERTVLRWIAQDKELKEVKDEHKKALQNWVFNLFNS